MTVYVGLSERWSPVSICEPFCTHRLRRSANSGGAQPVMPLVMRLRSGTVPWFDRVTRAPGTRPPVVGDGRSAVVAVPRRTAGTGPAAPGRSKLRYHVPGRVATAANVPAGPSTTPEQCIREMTCCEKRGTTCYCCSSRWHCAVTCCRCPQWRPPRCRGDLRAVGSRWPAS